MIWSKLENWLWIRVKNQSTKQRGQNSGWKVPKDAHVLFFTHTLCMNSVIAMFLLVNCMNTSNHLLFLPLNAQNEEQKPNTKIIISFTPSTPPNFQRPSFMVNFFPWRSMGRNAISNTRSPGSLWIKGTCKSLLKVDLSVPLMHSHLSDFGALILFWIISKECTVGRGYSDI